MFPLPPSRSAPALLSAMVSLPVFPGRGLPALISAFQAAAKMSGGQRLANDPVTWASERAGVHLWSKQREIAETLAAHKRTAVQSAHGIGKSFLAATLAAWWVDVHPADETMVVTTAPSLDQVHAILWEEIRGLHDRASLSGVVQRTDRWLVGGRLVGMGRKPPDYSESAFQGIHRRYVLVILDEACGIPAWLWTAVETITTGDDCRIMAIGNPDDPNSHSGSCARDAPAGNISPSPVSIRPTSRVRKSRSRLGGFSPLSNGLKTGPRNGGRITPFTSLRFSASSLPTTRGRLCV